MESNRTYNLVMSDLVSYLNKGSYEEYAFYVAIRMAYKNSKIFSPTPNKVMKLCNVGYTRACQLLAFAKSDTTGHFCISKRDKGLVALSNKGKVVRQTKRGKDYLGDLVYKIGKGEYTLKQIVKLLKRAMLLYFIYCATSERNKRATEEVEDDRQAEPKMIKQRLMQHFCKMSRTSLNRLVNELADEGKIEKSPRTFQCVISCLNDETAAAYSGTKYIVNKKNNTAWVCFICTYLISETSAASFKHIIWRKREHSTKKKVEAKWVGNVNVDRYYEKMHD